MYLEELIEVAIGLILVYIVLSVAVMSLQEWIVSVLQKRAKDLEAILREMLAEAFQPSADSSNGGIKSMPEHSSGILEKIYGHALIQSLKKGDGKPSYIPVDKFVLALFDTVITAGSDASTIKKTLEELKSYEENVPEALQAGLLTTIDELEKKADQTRDDPIKMSKLRKEIEAFANQYTEYDIGPIYDAILHSFVPVAEEQVIQALKRGADTLTIDNIHLKHTLDDLIHQAEMYTKAGESKLVMVRANAEKWFTDTMDRASGWYKRTMHMWALTIGLVLAVIFNVDTVEIATRLWIQPTLRQSLVVAAEAYQLPEGAQGGGEVLSPTDTINRLQNSLAGLHLPIGWTFESLGPDIFNPATDRCTLFPQSRAEGQPGKDVFGVALNGACKRWANPPRDWGILTKLLGFLITGIAAMQGAPFWFDIIQKLVNVRSAGVKPEEKATK